MITSIDVIYKIYGIFILGFILGLGGTLISGEHDDYEKRAQINKTEVSLDTIEVTTKDYIQKMKIVSFDGQVDTTFVFIKK